MAPHSPCSIIKKHVRVSREHTQKRHPGEKPSRARSTHTATQAPRKCQSLRSELWGALLEKRP